MPYYRFYNCGQNAITTVGALGASVEKVPPSKSLKYDQEFRVRRVHEYLAANSKSYWDAPIS